jgi:hypothetical protein
VGGSGKEIKEISKYKNKDDFVNAQLTVYRATESKRKEGLPAKHVTDKKSIADEYSNQSGGKVQELKLLSSANVVNFSSKEADPVTELWGVEGADKIREVALKHGIDAIKYDFDPSGKYGIAVFNEKMLYTKEELISVYNKHNSEAEKQK